jgi:carboxyl-terminal processing protease
MLDDRTLLAGAFAAFTQELQRRGLDQSMATLPRLTGHRTRDWAAFSKTYQKVLAALPDNAELRQALAATVMQGMLASLHDNHVDWGKGRAASGIPAGESYGLGILTLFGGRIPADATSGDVMAPLYLKSVAPGSPAAQVGLRPGDIITAVNDVPTFVNGMFSTGVLPWLLPRYPQNDKVRVTLQRPATGQTWTVELQPALFRESPPEPSVKLVHGDIAEVELPQFAANSADKVLQGIASLRKSTQLRGVILDLRGNGGGSAEEVAKLLGAFAHGKVWSKDCNVRGRCTANYTNDTTPLLHLPLVVLTDSLCASACDAFSGAVKDLKLGKLVGSRTAGVVSGLPAGYVLNDDSTLLLVSRHEVSANGEIINGIGVATDYQAPLTAPDLSAGRDPGIDKALLLLTS